MPVAFCSCSVIFLRSRDWSLIIIENVVDESIDRICSFLENMSLKRCSRCNWECPFWYASKQIRKYWRRPKFPEECHNWNINQWSGVVRFGLKSHKKKVIQKTSIMQITEKKLHQIPYELVMEVLQVHVWPLQNIHYLRWIHLVLVRIQANSI